MLLGAQQRVLLQLDGHGHGHTHKNDDRNDNRIDDRCGRRLIDKSNSKNKWKCATQETLFLLKCNAIFHTGNWIIFQKPYYRLYCTCEFDVMGSEEEEEEKGEEGRSHYFF